MKGSKFTDMERHAIKQAIIDAMYTKLNDNDTISLIRNRTGQDIGHSTLGFLKREIKSGEIELWLKNYAEIGFMEVFKESVEELDQLSLPLWNKLNHEASKPLDEQRDYKLVRLTEMLLKLNQEKSLKAFQLPVLNFMKDLIDKGKLYDKQPIRYHELTSSDEDGSEGSRSGRPEPEDDNRVA